MSLTSRSFHLRINGVYPVLLALLLMTVTLTVKAQDAKPADSSAFDRYAIPADPSFQADRYYVIEMNVLPPAVKVVRQLDERTAIIKINDPAVFYNLKAAHIAPARNTWKSAVQPILFPHNKNQRVIVAGSDLSGLINAIKKLQPAVEIVSTDLSSNSCVIKISSSPVIDRLLSLPEVIFIDLQQKAKAETAIIGYDRSFHGINTLDYSIAGADGKNITAGVKEQKMEAADLDLYKRVLPSTLAAAGITNHATVISSIIGGAGNSYYDGRGIANHCNFFSSSFNNLFPDEIAILNNNKVTVQNHSYGTVIQQYYGAEAVSYDAQLWNNKTLLHVFSAGNQGTAAASEGKYSGIKGYANLTGNFKMAKNIITVGAIDNKENIPAESSAGPLYDGRIAPQLTALGPNGTSDAAAMVSGTIAVMQQVYADSNAQLKPGASLIKAVLYNTADEIYNAGPDYKTGYGLLNSYAAVKAIQDKQYDGSVIGSSSTWLRTLILPADIALLKVTLAWTDSAAGLNNNKALLNDLDLEIKDLATGIIYKPWCLATVANADSLNKPAVRKRDFLNTAEQVSIINPATGAYEIKVTGTNITGAGVPFNIAYLTDTLHHFLFTSPQHASDVIRDDQPDIFIRWKTSVNPNETGNLYISYDGGAGWQLISQDINLSTGKYKWTIKDTASKALLKMETAFGNFLSKPFVISKATRLTVDFLCADSFRLSWNKHIYAGSYKLFCLTDSPYLKHILTVTDTFITLSRSAYPFMTYAVEPLLSNGLGATRSLATDIGLQGVKCFYSTLYYTLQDANQLSLHLQLSLPANVDSVYFEQVDANGQVLKNYPGKKVSAANALYLQQENNPPSGTSYWRARLVLKNGKTIYTEIISVLTSGKRYVLFYPSPVSRNGVLNFTFQQGVPPGSQVRLYDMPGKFLASYQQSDVINVSVLPVGVIVYKLFAADNKLLETGKILIQ